MKRLKESTYFVFMKRHLFHTNITLNVINIKLAQKIMYKSHNFVKYLYKIGLSVTDHLIKWVNQLTI